MLLPSNILPEKELNEFRIAAQSNYSHFSLPNIHVNFKPLALVFLTKISVSDTI